MSKDAVGDWSETAANNTDVGGISIAEGMTPADLNNAIRECMAQIAAFYADAYTKAAVLGTVSQSGGDPTGAVIERDANANGTYVRFADGTQICEHTALLNLASGDTSDLTYPKTFNGLTRPFGAASAQFSGSSALRDVYKCSVGSTGTAWRIRNNGSNFEDEQSIKLYAFGYWFVP